MTLYNGEIIDAHMHLWDLKEQSFGNTYSWLMNSSSHIAGNLELIRKNYLLEDYLQDTKGHNVVKSVHVQAESENIKGETEWLQSIADKSGFPHGIVAKADLSADNIEDILSFHSKFQNVKGIRQLLNWHVSFPKFIDKPGYLLDKKWRQGFAMLNKFNFSFDLHIWYTQIGEAIDLLHAFPNTQVILDHTGLPFGYLDSSEDAFNGWKQSLKECSNVVLKISGLSMTYHDPRPQTFKPLIDTAIEIFGVDRCLFASNFPVDKLQTSYFNLFNTYKQCVSHLSESDQRKLFYSNAERVYKL